MGLSSVVEAAVASKKFAFPKKRKAAPLDSSLVRLLGSCEGMCCGFGAGLSWEIEVLSSAAVEIDGDSVVPGVPDM